MNLIASGQCLREQQKNDATVSVLLLDLDDFRDINDSLGHDTGDQVLAEVANRLRSNFPDDVMITRLGGDEFALLVDGSVNTVRPEDMAQEILLLMQKPFDVLGNQLFLTASIGIVTTEETSSSAEDMIRALIWLCIEQKSKTRVAMLSIVRIGNVKS